MAYSALRRYQSNTRRNHSTDVVSDEEIRLVLIGKAGNGKSASGNTILGRNAFESQLSPVSITSECQKARGLVDGCRVAVIDTPGIFDTTYEEAEVIQRVKQCISLSAPGPHVFLIVMRLGKFTEEEEKTVELLQQLFGYEVTNFSLVLFTQGDQLGNQTIEDYFSKCGKLSRLISECNWRYHVFDNRSPSQSQVTQFFIMIKSIISDNGGTFYTNAMFQEAERAIQEQQRMIQEAAAEQKREEEERLKAVLQGEELQEKLKRLDEEYEQSSRKKAEKKNKFLKGGIIMTAAEVGLAIGAAATVAGGPVCIGIGAVVGGLVGAAVGAVSPAAVIALKKKSSKVRPGRRSTKE